MSRTADILVRTRGGRPLALVEAKNLPGLTEGDAADLRDAVVEHAGDTVPYVMIVSQSAGFLWQLQAGRSGAAAHYGQAQALDMNPVFRAYLSEADLNKHIRGTDLDLILSHWLGDVARGRTDVLPRTSEQGPLSRLVADMRDAQVNLEAAA